MTPNSKKEIVFLYHGATSHSSVQRPANYALPRLILHLHEQGYKVTVFNTENNERVDDNLVFEKFSLYSFFRLLWNNYKNKRKCLVVFHQVGDFKNELSRAAYYLKKVFRYKFVVRMGGVYYGEQQVNSKEFELALKQYKYFKACDCFISNDDGTAISLFAQKVGLSKDQVVTYINGFPPKIKVEASQRQDKIVCISRLSHEKAVDYVIRSYHKALPKLTKPYPLHIVGDGQEYDALKRLTVELGIEDKVVFEGFSDDWVHHYSTSKLVLAGLAFNPMIEGICTSTPVIALELGGLKKIYAGFKNVFIVKYPRGGYGRIPEEYMDGLVEETSSLIVNILNGGYSYETIDFDEDAYGWTRRLNKETELYESML